MNADAVLERPLTVAEIFDRAVAMCVRRWPIAVGLGLITAIPDTVVRGFHHGRLPDGTDFWWALLLDTAVAAICAAPLVRVFGDPAIALTAGALRLSAVRDFRRSFFSYLLIVALFLAAFGVALGIPAVAFVLGRDSGSVMGGAIAAGLLALPTLAVLVPLSLVLGLAYPIAILEAVGPVRGLALAWRRVRHSDLRRSWLLGAAILLTSTVPYVAETVAFDQLASVPGWWWLAAAQPIPLALTALIFSTAALTVAAVDYRNRSEGADLLGAIGRVAAP